MTTSEAPPAPPATAATDRGRPAPADRARQVAVTVAYVACIVGNLFGAGVVGPVEVSTAGNEAFAADASLLTPAGSAFSIWSVVYAGLTLHVAVQWLPSRATSARHRATGWLVVAASLLNAGWLTVSLQGYLWTSVVVIAALLAVLVEIVRRLTRHPAGGTDRTGLTERVAVDGTFGLYVGWVSLAVVANVAAASTAQGAARTGDVAVTVAVVVLVGVALVTALVARAWGGRVAVALAQAWGLAWVAYGRLAGDPESLVVGLVAGVAALVPLVAVGVVRRGRTPARVAVPRGES
ncbi:tryptophan-rich sensory protein [Nocardioides sp. ChNu-153]|uniref:hypothetical protein n=1 Tax=unclassified Nocardioides TaxID=2615069 RepID=UPI002406BE8C|nr:MULTISPECIES: hypothetical protein [unclassified Nocardioides]MDF9715065.1 hypothetical protein [Nocardioides sp. ChNu-99]MDN7122334.1 tryptophan-rich sensory protein [Nocardioides sp. ChNu-153]